MRIPKISDAVQGSKAGYTALNPARLTMTIPAVWAIMQLAIAAANKFGSPIESIACTSRYWCKNVHRPRRECAWWERRLLSGVAVWPSIRITTIDTGKPVHFPVDA
jgi:hypothetical protein